MSRTAHDTEAPVRAAAARALARVVLSAEVRQHLGIKAGEDLILSEDERGIRLQTFAQAVKVVQEIFAPHRVPGASVVDELIRDREEEARREYDA